MNESRSVMPLSSESLLQLLQRFIRNSTKIKQIHSVLITNGHLIFNPHPSTFLWTTTLLYNTLIRAYLNLGLPRTTLILFTHMLSHQSLPNAYTFPSLTKAAVSLTPSSSLVREPLHAQALKRGVLSDPFVQTSFISLYAQIGFTCSAHKVFDEITEPCVISCNAMLDGFCKDGDIGSAVLLFESMLVRDVFTWTSVVNGFVKNGSFDCAIRFFRRMMVQGDTVECFVKPNEATFVSVLSACANCHGRGGFYYGRQIHGYIIKNKEQLTVFLGTALIALYGKMGDSCYAMEVFHSMVKKEVCTWNALIGTLAFNGREELALDMFEKMKVEGWCPNEVTLVAVLAACAHAKLVALGLEFFYSMSSQFGIVPRMEHYGCVVDLLGRAGFLAEAKGVISRMPFEPDASVLAALLSACKDHGEIELGNEVAKRLLDLQPQHCGRYVLLWSIYAEAGRWDHAASLRKIMVDAGVQKAPAYSMIDMM